MYQCEVLLPEKSPVRGLIGKPASTKSLAKKMAAFDTCILLRENNLLDDYFKSTFHRILPAMRNAKLAITSKQTNEYSMMTKPVFWKRGYGVEPESLFLTIISLDPARPLHKDYRSVLLLTREPLPQFPEFPIYLEDDVETTIRTISLRKALPVSPHELDLMTLFTLRMFRDLYNKTYEANATTVPYWLLPASTSAMLFNENLEPSDAIDWGSLDFVNNNDEVPRTSCSSGDMVGRFVYDRWDGKYRYFLTGINKSLRPSDPPPSFLPRRRHMENIMSYGLSLYKKARVNFLETCDWQQCVFDAELISLRRNLLDKMSEADKNVEVKSVVCLEYTVISAVSIFLAFPTFHLRGVDRTPDSFLCCCDLLCVPCYTHQARIIPHCK